MEVDDELLRDNNTKTHLAQLKEMLGRWNTRRFFRVTYRPSRNGIEERHHCTLKAMAERGRFPLLRQSSGTIRYRG